MQSMEIVQTVNGRALPTEEDLAKATLYGNVLYGLIIAFLAIAGFMLITRLFIRVNILGGFVKLMVICAFISRCSLINVNFGAYLTRTMDMIFKYNLNWYFEIADDSEYFYLAHIKGKLTDYNVPVFVFNSILIQMIFYLTSCLLGLISHFVKLRSERAARFSKFVSFTRLVVLSITIMDIVFYSTNEIANHIVNNKVNSSFAAFNYFLAILTFMLCTLDCLKFIKASRDVIQAA